MKMTIAERINILGILPSEGDAATMASVRWIRGELFFSDEEIKEFAIVQDSTGRFFWSQEFKDHRFDVAIGKQPLGVIKARLETLNATGKLNLDSIGLYERFCAPVELDNSKAEEDEKRHTDPAPCGKDRCDSD